MLKLAPVSTPALRRRALTAYLSVIILGTLLTATSPYSDPRPEAQTNSNVATYIATHSDPSDSIYVWGASPDIYLEADRSPAGRFFYLLPLMSPGYGPEGVSEMLQSWSQSPPRFIVDASFGTVNHVTMAPLLVDHPVDTGDGRNLSADLGPLREFVRIHYRLATTIDDKRIYIYTGGS
jgi:hypothetical protein